MGLPYSLDIPLVTQLLQIGVQRNGRPIESKRCPFPEYREPGHKRHLQYSASGSPLSSARFLRRVDDVVGSRGILDSLFPGLSGTPVDDFPSGPEPVFIHNGVNQCKVANRNALSGVNAIFPFRSFRGCRANNSLIGLNPGGRGGMHGVAPPGPGGGARGVAPPPFGFAFDCSPRRTPGPEPRFNPFSPSGRGGPRGSRPRRCPHDAGFS